MTNLNPQYGWVASADDYKMLNECFDDGQKIYKVVYFPSGTFVRKGTPLQINSEGYATICDNVQKKANAVADYNVDARYVGLYARVVWHGDTMVDIVSDSESCVYQNTVLVPHMNGRMRSVNAVCNIMNAPVVVDTTACTFILQRGTASNCDLLARVGDTIQLNVNSFVTTITSMPNNSTIGVGVLAFGKGLASGVSSICQVIFAGATALQSGISASCANVISRRVDVPANAVVNVCTAGTTWLVNSSVVGSLIKVGDILTITDSGTSYRTVDSLINARAFTVNAAPTTEFTGNIGVAMNINSRVIACVVNNL